MVLSPHLVGEFWKRGRKGEEYYGSGEGELGHDKEAWFSKFLVWMRTNHGGMKGGRYKEVGECGCGEVEDRDHILLRCGEWWEERWKVWKGKYNEGWVGDGWIDMRGMLFGKRGVDKLREFAEGIKWKEWQWERGKWKREELRKGKEIVERLRGCGGYRIGWSSEEREEVRRLNRERMRKKRGLLTQATTPNASVVTGAKRLSKRMVEDGWKKVDQGRVVKNGVDKGRGENGRILGLIHGHRGKGKGKGKGI